jgi:DNA-binding NtrC family response regulator
MNTSAARERILIVDDDESVAMLFKRILEKEGYEVESASSGEEALGRLEAQWFDLVVSDLRMPGLDGLEFLRRAKLSNPSVPCIVLTGYATVDSAVAAMKEGAHDYLTKPINNDEMKLVVKKALEVHRLVREVERLRQSLGSESSFGNILGKSKAMRGLFRLIRQVAHSQATILVFGESGTGKELVARSIHQHSPRRDRPFVAIDCGALPETLLESELFGHVRGSFTGAISNKKGLFEEAHGGTLLLDEIGGTSLAFQSKLLRVLQENEIRPVGSSKSIRVDVRVIAATNRDLKAAVKEGTFREDLYYRLAVIPIVLPPLRERREDIPLLANHFVAKYCEKNRLEPKRLSAKALKLLIDHPWPGNVRELENVIERAVLTSPGREIDPGTLFPEPERREESPQALRQAIRTAMEILEKRKIIEATEKAGGIRAEAARILGISRATLYNKLKRYNLTH